MSLRSKIVFILSVLVVTYAVLDNLIQRFMVRETFVALENEQAGRNLQRALSSIEREAQELEADCQRWAEWKATKRFLQTQNLVAETPQEAILAENGVDLLYLCDRDGFVTWGRIEEPATREQIQLREFPAGRLLPFHPLLPSQQDPRAASGIMETERGLMFVASHPILHENEGQGHVGAVLMGRFIDQGLAQTLGERVQVSLDIWPLESQNLPDRERELVDQITGSAEPAVERTGDSLSIYATLTDVRLAPSLLLRVRLPREITTQGERVIFFAQISTIATSLLILTFLLLLLQKIVIKPLTELTHHAVEIGKTDDATLKTNMDREDEIGLLSKEFDRMLEKLAEARAQNIRSARTAGMSEIATGVLHNIGNVLNSVNVSANMAARKTNEMVIGDLERLLDVLRKNEDDLAEFISTDPKGKHMLPFLSSLTDSLKGQRADLTKELTSLRAGVEHMAELVRSQQSYAVKTVAFEKASVNDLVDKAVEMCEKAGRPGELDIFREYTDLPPIAVDSQKVTEIIVNLVQNARHALLESGNEPKELTVRTLEREDDIIAIEVEDNGIGISEENLTRIFNHGFTTKKAGHGFGLHASANSATELGGSLRATSRGHEAGALFTLEIPRHARKPDPTS